MSLTRSLVEVGRFAGAEQVRQLLNEIETATREQDRLDDPGVDN